jgi:hypothetical protein
MAEVSDYESDAQSVASGDAQSVASIPSVPSVRADHRPVAQLVPVDTKTGSSKVLYGTFEKPLEGISSEKELLTYITDALQQKLGRHFLGYKDHDNLPSLADMITMVTQDEPPEQLGHAVSVPFFSPIGDDAKRHMKYLNYLCDKVCHSDEYNSTLADLNTSPRKVRKIAGSLMGLLAMHWCRCQRDPEDIKHDEQVQHELIERMRTLDKLLDAFDKENDEPGENQEELSESQCKPLMMVLVNLVLDDDTTTLRHLPRAFMNQFDYGRVIDMLSSQISQRVRESKEQSSSNNSD